MAIQEKDVGKRDLMRWTKFMDGVLIDALVYEDINGAKIDDLDGVLIDALVYEDINGAKTVDLDGLESKPVTPAPTPTPQVNTENHSVTSVNKRKRKTSQKDYSEVKIAIESVAKQLEKGNIIANERNEIAKKTRVRVYSEEEVFEELLRIGVEAHVRYKTYDFLTEDAARVRKFFGCPVQERKDYLMHQMSGTSI